MPDNGVTWIEEELARLKDAGLYTNIRTIDSPMDAWVTIDGRKLLNFCANNYLGLANHPRLREAAKHAIDRYGVGPGAVRTIAGTMSLHVEWSGGWPNSRKPKPASPFRAVSPPTSPPSPRWLAAMISSFPTN
ncbi:MAG: hypothetical protein R2856_13965 [Caldilineaceae bacterium]